MSLSPTQPSSLIARSSLTAQMRAPSLKRRPRPTTWRRSSNIMARSRLAATMRLSIRNNRICRDNAVRIDRFMAEMIMPHDMFHIHSLCNAWPLV